jgi:hypothetical protein
MIAASVPSCRLAYSAFTMKTGFSYSRFFALTKLYRNAFSLSEKKFATPFNGFGATSTTMPSALRKRA